MDNSYVDKQSIVFEERDMFFNKYWQKEPVVLHNTVLSVAEDVFETIVLSCDKFRAQSTDAPSLKLYVNNTQIIHDLPQYLPNTEDKSPKGYEQRLERELHAESFVLFVAGFERYSATFYNRAQELLGHLCEHTGIPAGHAELELFLGRYTYTPGGIHNEKCTNFQWVIDGNKTMHTWPEATWNTETLAVSTQHDPTSLGEEHFLDDVRLDDYRNSSKALHGKPGDILYWPSRYWHVGETPELSMAITLAIYMNGRPSHTVLQTVQQMVEQRSGPDSTVQAYPFPFNILGTFDTVLPTSLQQPLDIIKEIANSTELQQTLIKQWLKRASNLSLSKTLDLLPAKELTTSDTIYRISRRPILYTHIDAQTSVYAVNGHCDTINTHANIVQLLDLLNSGEHIDVGEIISQYSTAAFDKTSTSIYRVLAFLYQARAIGVVQEAQTH